MVDGSLKPVFENSRRHVELGAAWSRHVRTVLDIRDPSTMTEDNAARVQADIAPLLPYRTHEPMILDLGSACGEHALSLLKVESEVALRDHGVLHNGKWNARVGEAGELLVHDLGLASMLSSMSGIALKGVHGATYIGYQNEGEFLDFHMDDLSFGESNFLLCLKAKSAAKATSHTVFLAESGFERVHARPGRGVLFDGATTPHARSPLAEGEEIILISFGLDTSRPEVQDPASLMPPSRPE